MSANRKLSANTNKNPKSARTSHTPLLESRRSSFNSDVSSNPESIKAKVEFAPIITTRRGSARCNLQSHPCFQSSLFDDQERAAGSYKEWKNRMVAKRLMSFNSKEVNKDYQLQHVLWSESVRQPRRLTIGNPQEISDLQVVSLKRIKSYALAALGGTSGKLEEKLDLGMLADLQIAFEEADIDNSGTLDIEEFKLVVKHAMKIACRSEEEVESLFMKINFTSNGKITWEDFCTFMQLNFTEKEEAEHHMKEVIFTLPAKQELSPHRMPINRIMVTGDHNFMVMSAEGIFSTWSPFGELKKVRKDVIEKRAVVKDKGDKQDTKRARIKWITDFIILTEFNKIVLGSGDRELQFWELSTFDPYCQVYSLHTVPIKLAYCYFDRDNVAITYGDTDGCVNILKFSNMGETLRLWKTSPSVNQMPSIQLDKARESSLIEFIRWKTHSDWIEQIKIDKRLNQIISCSNDQQYALVIGCISQSEASLQSAISSNKESQQINNLNSTESAKSVPGEVQTPTATTTNVIQNSNSNGTVKISNQNSNMNQISSSSFGVSRRREETVFKIHKGVKVFDFSFEKNLLITGGMDRMIRLYNPYMPARPIAHLRRHTTPIFFIHLSIEDDRIFTMSTDKCLNVWDLIDHSCLNSIRPKLHKITGELQACCYNQKTKSLLVNTDKTSFLSLKLKSYMQNTLVLSHKEPVTCFLYNKEFRELISCTEGGSVKLWDLETGKCQFEFTNAHGDEAITCMSYDGTGRRLITGSRGGECKIWNFNNGHCIKTLRKEDVYDEITDITYVQVYNNKFIVTVGWDRSINIYDDKPYDMKEESQPLPRWPEDIENGHKEDIICVGKSESNFLATADYNGQIIIWNMVSSKVFCRLISKRPLNYSDESLDGDLLISKVIFLNKESYSEKGAHLISSGPWGRVHFWNVFHNQNIYAEFTVNTRPGTQITKMCVDAKFRNLFIADSHGFISNWNIQNYATTRVEQYPPKLNYMWRAHCGVISSIEFIETSKVLLSGASDCTIRVWSFDGMYIGTLGQEESWNLYDMKTYKHPHVPFDILTDYKSMPEHPIIEENLTTAQVLLANRTMESSDKDKESFTIIGPTKVMINDQTIQEKIEKMNVKAEMTGKRHSKILLRHEIMMQLNRPKDTGTKNYYHMLKCFDYDDSPESVRTPVTTQFKNKNF